MYVGYVRVSHVGGRSGDSFRSPDDQAESIRAWAKARGAAVEVLPPELDESGGRADRPILREAVEGIEAGRWSGLIVAYLSRLSRSTRHLLDVWTRIEDAGGKVVAVAENLDTSTPAGRMQRTILGAVAEHELDTKSEHFERLRESATARGIWQRKRRPIGYDRDPISRRLTPNADAAIVKQAFADRARGRAIEQIATDLAMTASGTRAVLRNRVYLGELHVGEHANLDAHTAIIDHATFDAVQALRQVRPPRGDGSISLLAGVVRCQGCGHVMARNSSGDYGGVYSCRGRHSAGVCRSRAAISAPKIEAYVSMLARAEIDVLRFSTSKRTSDLDRLRDDLAKAKAELAAYLEGTAAAGLPLEAYADGARKRNETVQTARAALDSAHTIAPLQGRFATGGEFWDDLNPGEQNRLLRGLADAVIVIAAGRGHNVPVAERVRVFRHGSLPDIRYSGGGLAMPIELMPFPDRDDERLIGVTRGKN